MNQCKRGALPSPRHKLAATEPFKGTSTIPSSYGVIPSQLSFWLNNRDGDCVTAEECANIALFNYRADKSSVIIADEEVQSWGGRHGFMNGASLTDVMDALQASANDGLVDPTGKTHYDGPYKSVDWTNDALLQAAIFESGAVKIGVAANQLEAGGSPGTNGWIILSGRQDNNTDHCVSLVGYGSLSELCTLLGVTAPAGANPATVCYLLFTWDSIGIVSASFMRDITSEAWVRSPSSITSTEAPRPQPAPGPSPRPQPAPTHRGIRCINKMKELHDAGAFPRVHAILELLEKELGL